MNAGAPDRATPAGLAGFRGWKALRHRNFRLFWTGQLISLVGTWMQTVAQAWLVLTLTNDPFTLGLVAAAQFIPVVFLGLFGGVVADHVPKRKALIATQVGSMTLAFVLAALTATGLVEVWQVVALALLLGVINSIDMPVRQAFVIEMVGREDVGNAVALNSSIFNAARIVGPAVAGIAIGVLDISLAFFLNGLSFIAVIVGLLLMRDSELLSVPHPPMPKSARAVLDDLGEGLGYVRRTTLVLIVITVTGLAATFAMNFNVVIPAVARDVLGSDAAGYGLLMAASGLGAVAAAISIAVRGGGSLRTFLGGALTLGVCTVLLALSRSFPVSCLLMVGIGWGGIAMAATANTTIQLAVPDLLRGRVMSVFLTTWSLSVPVGGLLIGAIASTQGVAVATAVGGVVTIGVVGLAVVWIARVGGIRLPDVAHVPLVLDPDEALVDPIEAPRARGEASSPIPR